MYSDATQSADDPYSAVQLATRLHLTGYGCSTYTFEGDPALIRLVKEGHPKRVLELGAALGYTACCSTCRNLDSIVGNIVADRKHVELARE